jgi:adenine/guanine/hypoxanthine permease
VFDAVPMQLKLAITAGIGLFILFIGLVVLRSAAGKVREISPLLLIVAAGFLVCFARGWIESLIGL